jgi:hypothetical protein
LAKTCRYGYRRITALLRQADWAVNTKGVERASLLDRRVKTSKKAGSKRHGLRWPLPQSWPMREVMNATFSTFGSIRPGSRT